ncbi:MAG: hypothetical protein R6U37_04680 [Dehalococcoidia bacterium]
MTSAKSGFGINLDSKYENFVRTMQREGIPVRRYREESWKRWFKNQWERMLNLSKN